MTKKIGFKKQKVKVKKIVYTVLAACFLIAIILTISFSPNMMGLMGNSVTDNYICPDGYELSENKCNITINAYKKGDANLDGEITDVDVNYIKDHISGVSLLINDNYVAADINGDNKVNSTDLNELNLYLSGMNNISEYICPSDYDIEGNKCYKSENAILVSKGNYNVGNAILYQGSYWYILEDQDDYLTLLKKDSLTVEELSNYTDGAVSEGMYYDNNNCVNSSTCGSFENSKVKAALDRYVQDISSDLKEVNGYKVRLINIDELSRFGFVDKTSTNYYEMSLSTPYWLKPDSGMYWIMNSDGNSLNKTFVVFDYNYKSYIYETTTYDTLAKVRPVVNVYKSVLK